VPVEPNPQPIDAWPRQVNISAPGMSIGVQIQSDGSGTATAADLDDALQSLIDFLQEWPGKIPGSNVTGSKYDTLLYLVSPTNPEPPPDPPVEEPEGLDAGSEAAPEEV
jgi:hypothetical protein